MAMVDASMRIADATAVPRASPCYRATFSRTVAINGGKTALKTLPLACLRDPASAPLLRFDRSQHWSGGSSSNIVRDFVFRGVYVDQVLDIHRTYGTADALLVLATEDLKEQQNATFNAALAHFGVAPVDVAGVSQSQLHER